MQPIEPESVPPSLTAISDDERAALMAVPMPALIDMAAQAGVRYNPAFATTLSHDGVLETVAMEGDLKLLTALIIVRPDASQ